MVNEKIITTLDLEIMTKRLTDIVGVVDGRSDIKRIRKVISNILFQCYREMRENENSKL